MKKNKFRVFPTVGFAGIMLCQLLFLPTARAQAQDFVKWSQLPDLNYGMDVFDTFGGVDPTSGLTYNKILADDFQCNQTGPITTITIWGSWLNNNVPSVAPTFDLSFHANIPASPAGGYSQPGAQLWDMVLAPQQVSLYASGVNEQFYNPDTQSVIGTDNQVWQYNFVIPTTSAFVQTYGSIYWLNVQVQPPPGYANSVFGWKTSYQHNLDAAVYGDNQQLSVPPPVWNPMYDTRPNSPYYGTQLDMAFELDTSVPEPASLALGGLGLGVLLTLRKRSGSH